MAGLEHFLILSAIIFCLGLMGVLVKKNIIAVLMSVELMFNAVNIAFLAFNRFVTPEFLTGHVFALFVITVAAGEVALALAIVIALFRNRETVDITAASTLKG